MRLSFVGDLMCSKEHLADARTKQSFDFDNTFANFDKQTFASDYLVGNLESPIASKSAGLVDHKWSFNAPIEFAEALQRAGFDLVSLANNHCLDRGIAGAQATVKHLDQIKLAHTGINLTNQTPQFLIQELDEMQVGFLSYAYGTNKQVNGHRLVGRWRQLVNLFQHQEATPRRWQLIQRLLFKIRRQVFWLRSPLRLRQMLIQVKRCRQAGAEFVVMCLHIGGQYNAEPEAYTRWVIDYLKRTGVDVVVACHEHVVHAVELDKQQLVAFSLGNFLYHPQSESLPRWAVEQLKAQYSIMLHLDLTRQSDGVKLQQASFSIFKNQLIAGRPQVVPIAYLAEHPELIAREQLQDDVQYIVNKVRSCQSQTVEIATEYPI